MRWYWIRFTGVSSSLPAGVALGCGVSSIDIYRALQLVERVVFEGELPHVAEVVEDVDLDRLDPNHVLPNIGNPLVEGVWFPLGFQA